MRHVLEMTRVEGQGSTRASWLDFQVDGQSLHMLLKAEGLVGCLGWGFAAAEMSELGQFLNPPADAGPTSRLSIYVCAECGDIGCGAITASVRMEGDHVEWTDFAYENDYDPGMTDRDAYSHVGPFHFQLQAYRKVLEARLSEIDTQPGDATDGASPRR